MWKGAAGVCILYFRLPVCQLFSSHLVCWQEEIKNTCARQTWNPTGSAAVSQTLPLGSPLTFQDLPQWLCCVFVWGMMGSCGMMISTGPTSLSLALLQSIEAKKCFQTVICSQQHQDIFLTLIKTLYSWCHCSPTGWFKFLTLKILKCDALVTSRMLCVFMQHF